MINDDNHENIVVTCECARVFVQAMKKWRLKPNLHKVVLI